MPEPEASPKREVIRSLIVLLLITLSACQGGSDRQAAAETLQEGLEAHRTGDLEAAEESYREVLEIEPDNKFALYNLALIQQTRGEASLAEQNYRRALTVDPDFVPALFNLAILRTEAGASQEALELYRHVIDLEPDRAAAHLNLGLLLQDLGRKKEAREELARAVELDPGLAPRAGTTGPEEEP
jgi:tetratricopeptide (TPR) repeat protein